MKRAVAILATYSFLSGCVMTKMNVSKVKYQNYVANNPDINQKDVENFIGSSNAIMREFWGLSHPTSDNKVNAALPTVSKATAIVNNEKKEFAEPTAVAAAAKQQNGQTDNGSGKTFETESEWRPVIDAGIAYTDTRCERFMDSLFWLNRARETASRQVGYTGSSISSALAVVEASKAAIGLTPLGFTLLDQTINNMGSGLLYNLNPSIVRNLVEKRQKAYIESLSASYPSKAIALHVI